MAAASFLDTTPASARRSAYRARGVGWARIFLYIMGWVTAGSSASL